MNNRIPPDGIEQDREEWLEALENIFENYGERGVSYLLASLSDWHAKRSDINPQKVLNTPYAVSYTHLTLPTKA